MESLLYTFLCVLSNQGEICNLVEVSRVFFSVDYMS